MKLHYNHNHMFLDIINSHGRGKLSKIFNIELSCSASFSTTAINWSKDNSSSEAISSEAISNISSEAISNSDSDSELKFLYEDTNFSINHEELENNLIESNNINTSEIINNRLYNIKVSSIDPSKGTNDKEIAKLVNSRLKLKNAERDKNLIKFRGGYTSYEKKTVLGNLLTLLNKDSLNEVLKNKLFVEFKENRGYSLLVQLDYFNNGVLSGLSPMKSMYITHDTNVDLISVNILNGLNKVINEYNMEAEECRVSVIWKDWAGDMEYSKMVEPVDRKAIIEEVLTEQSKVNLNSSDKLCKIMKFMNQSNVTNYINEFPKFDSITKLELFNNSEMCEFIDNLSSTANFKFKFNIYKANNFNIFKNDV